VEERRRKRGGGEGEKERRRRGGDEKTDWRVAERGEDECWLVSNSGRTALVRGGNE